MITESKFWNVIENVSGRSVATVIADENGVVTVELHARHLTGARAVELAAALKRAAGWARTREDRSV
ncbi:MAG: hypothetical protein LBI33_12770 [Propionibacteriaceae bacterium]|jgi:hypothetical protein|nr:hypothetical protein [Propionibacteriaceae bacterium]